MNADDRDARNTLGASVRRVALVLLVLFVFRGATAGLREFGVNGNWLAGISGGLFVVVLGYWLFTLYVGADSRE